MPFVTTSDTTLYYAIDAGTSSDAPVLVLSNSLGTDHHMWDGQIELLAQHFRVLRYDTRGHGQSRSRSSTTTFAELGGDVLRLLDAAGVRRAHFCGLSMGGITGMWLGAHAPDRIARLVLCNTAAHIGPPSIWDQRIATVAADGMAAITAGVIARWFTPAFVQAEPGAVAPIEAMLLATPRAGYIAACHALREADFNADLNLISAPTLVIAGAADPATTVADAHKLVAGIAAARLEILAAAHLSNIEARDQFNRVLTNFLLE